MVQYRDVIQNPDLCCGCRNCLNKCPKKCISMEMQSSGFYFPKINTELCVNCGVCESVCPAINEFSVNTETPSVYCTYSKDEAIRFKASSGGIFGIIANRMIEIGGAVYGAAFDENLHLKCQRADTKEELEPLYKSKYIESYLGKIFFDVEYQLKKERPVLFCGTPCQCSALTLFLGKPYPNLLLVDFLCHGVPSQELFYKSVENFQNKHHIKIKTFQFRAKPPKSGGIGHYYSMTYFDKHGKSHEKRSMPQHLFPYYRNYSNYTSFRQSCYGCRYATINRPTDFTIGDFWKLDRLQKCEDFVKGYSMLFVRSEKAKLFLDEQVKNDLELKQYEINDVIDLNPPISKGLEESSEHKEFMMDYEHLSYDALEKKYMIVKTDLFHRGVRFIRRIINR